MAFTGETTDLDQNQEEILASREGATTQTVCVVGGTEDSGNSTVTTLRAGFILCRITSGGDAGKYAAFNSALSDGTEDESTAVVVKKAVSIPASSDVIDVSVWTEGQFHRDRLYTNDSGNFSFADCPHLRRRDRAVT